MATLRELKAQMAALEEQAASARLAEIEEVLADIRAKVADYGFTERDVFGRRRGTRATPGGGVVPPK
ncbi:H-NS histone family protein [Paraburkholderia sp. BR10937]|uniref:H-NS histone family protein n=1 Tax=Paraburkholderia unamae TaxID=219649 RepID=A0ACC6RT12_9BURK